MAERLNSLAYQQNAGHHSIPNNNNSSPFNPRSVSVDIRTPEELAAVNQFLVALGRDVSGSGRSQANFSPTDNYFDPSNLSQLGLTGMPGMPPTGSPYPDQYHQPSYTGYPSSRSHSSMQYSGSGMYGMAGEPSMGYNSSNDYSSQSSRRSSKQYPFNSNQHYHHPTPPLESGSPHSSVSTPVTTTPPQVPMSMPDAFDMMRPARGAPVVAQLAPHDYYGKTMRQMVPLKSVPTLPRPERTASSVELRLPLSMQRAAGASSSSSSNARAGPSSPVTISSRIQSPSASSKLSSKPGSLYPLLTSGDVQYKLPPLNRNFRSPSPESRASTPSSTDSSPHTRTQTLPSIHALAAGARSGERSPVNMSMDIASDETLVRRVRGIELEHGRGEGIPADERRRHAKLIMDLLVSINKDFKNRWQPRSRDVEMAAV